MPSHPITLPVQSQTSPILSPNITSVPQPDEQSYPIFSHGESPQQLLFTELLN